MGAIVTLKRRYEKERIVQLIEPIERRKRWEAYGGEMDLRIIVSGGTGAGRSGWGTSYLGPENIVKGSRR